MLKRTIVMIEEDVLARLQAIRKSDLVSICATVRRAIDEHLALRDAQAAAQKKRRTGR